MNLLKPLDLNPDLGFLGSIGGTWEGAVGSVPCPMLGGDGWAGVDVALAVASQFLPEI